jgi:YHS domain-containing protein
MNKLLIVIFLSAIGVYPADANAAGEDDLTGIKCIVRGEAQAKKEFSAKHLGGNVYFCCPRCKTAFESNPGKYAAKANHQLVVTGQYVQNRCPFSGQPFDENLTAKVGGVEIGFCNENCLRKIESASDLNAKSVLVFSESAFKRAFAKNEQIELANVRCIIESRPAVAENWVGYLEGKAFFCCGKCKAAFEKKKHDERTIRSANEQLWLTGQYVQRACPITGREDIADHYFEIAGRRIGLCCDECVQRLESIDNDDERSKLIFGESVFKKAFTKK